MRKVALVGGPAAGQFVDTTCSNITVPVFNDRVLPGLYTYQPLVRGLLTYKVRKARLGRMAWYVAVLDDEPINPITLMFARPAPYVFGNAT